MLVIALAVLGACFRAEYKMERVNGESMASGLFISLGPAIIYSLLALLPSLLLPTWFRIAGATICFLFICIVYFWPETEGRGYAVREEIAKELVGTLIVFMLLVISSYTVYQ